MEMNMIIIRQIAMMFMMMGVGFVLYRRGLVSERGSQDMSNILLMICSPALTILSFNMNFEFNLLVRLGISFLLSVFAIALSFAAASLFFKKAAIEQCAVSLSNSGFIGIPLVSSVMGPEYIFYLSAYLMAFNLVAWSYGVFLISGRKEEASLQKILLNPATVSVTIGLLLFVLPVEVPSLMTHTLNSLGSVNTPLAMLVLGGYVAKSNVLQMLKMKENYVVSFFKLVVMPALIFAFLSLFPSSLNDIKLVILIASAAPTGVIVAMFAQRYGKDYAHAARIISVSTLLCLLTIPLFIMMAKTIW